MKDIGEKRFCGLRREQGADKSGTVAHGNRGGSILILCLQTSVS